MLFGLGQTGLRGLHPVDQSFSMLDLYCYTSCTYLSMLPPSLPGIWNEAAVLSRGRLQGIAANHLVDLWAKNRAEDHRDSDWHNFRFLPGSRLSGHGLHRFPILKLALKLERLRFRCSGTGT